MAFSAIFKANFGLFRLISACFDRIGYPSIRPNMADTARFWPNQLGSARIEADLARIEPSRRESEKKKKNTEGTDVRATALDAASRVGPYWMQVRHLCCRVHAF